MHNLIHYNLLIIKLHVIHRFILEILNLTSNISFSLFILIYYLYINNLLTILIYLTS